MPQSSISRRRALLVGAGSLLAAALPPMPAFAARRRGARGFGLRVTPADFGGGRVSRVLRAPRRFELLGLRDAPDGIEIRTRPRGGSWTRWTPVTAHADHVPDRAARPRASDPIWVGAARELQLRARRAPRASLHVHLVDGGAPAPRRIRAARANRGHGTPAIIPRDAWGAGQVPPRAAPSFGQVQVAFVHHTVTANGYAPEQSAGMVLSIAKYHRDVNGWNDIGYNFLVDRFGQVFEGRAGGVDQPVVGAHCAGSNSISTGIAVLGTYDAAGIEPPALEALAGLIGWKLPLHGAPVTGRIGIDSKSFERISGHRDGYSTACPGNALYAQLPALRARAAQLADPVAQRPRASLHALETAVPYGHAARFSGVVQRSDGRPAPGERVLVQKRGTTRWVTVDRTTADATGAWMSEVLWRRTGEVRARVAGIVTPVVEVTAVPRIGTRSLPRRVRAGARPLVRGTVRPGIPVYVQIERDAGDGRWVTVARVPAKVRGTRWEVRVPLQRPALYRITARTRRRDGGAIGRRQVLRAVRPGRSLNGGSARPGTRAPQAPAPGGTAAAS